MATDFRFSESDSLLCYHGPMLYEAKCLKRRKTGDGKAQYFIHYKGWNSKWEEWVDDDRVLAVNSANMNKMASLKEIHLSSKKSGSKKSITTVKEELIRNVIPLKGRKRKHSEISIESIPSSNLSSPSEHKAKRRGRPPKLFSTPKSELGETDEVYQELLPDKTSEVTDNIKVVKDTADGAKKIEAIKKSERIKETTEVAKKTEEDQEISKEAKKPTENKETAESVTKIEASKTTEENKEIAEAAKNTEVNIKIADESKKTEANKKIDKSAKNTEANEKIAKAAINTEANKKIAESAKKSEAIKKPIESDEMNKVIEANKVKAEKETKTNKDTEAMGTVEASEAVETNNLTNKDDTVTKADSTKITEADLSKVTEADESMNKTYFKANTNELTDYIDDSDDDHDADDPIITTDFKEKVIEKITLDDDAAADDTTNTTNFKEKVIEITIDEDDDDDDDTDDDDDNDDNDDNDDDDDDNDDYLDFECLVKLCQYPINKSIVIVFKIPDNLKRSIALDYYQVHRHGKVLKFPRSFTIKDVIREYMCSQKTYNERENAIGFCMFLDMYFNFYIHKQLLYNPEIENNLYLKATNELKVRLKIEEVSEENFEKSYSIKYWHHVYSPIYILRLFEILPSLLSKGSHLPEFYDLIVLNVNKFLKFVGNNINRYISVYTNDMYVNMKPVENADL